MDMLRADNEGFDWALCAAMLLLAAVGVLTIYSALYPLTEENRWEDPIFRQALFLAIGIVFYGVFAWIDYRVFIRLSPWIYLGIISLLIATLFIGGTAFGSQRRIEVGPFDIQSSELAKVLMILVLARILDGELYSLKGLLPLLMSLVAMALPVILIYEQPDFGTAVVLGITWLGMVFLAGVHWEHLLLLGLIGSLAAPLVWFEMEDYMRERVVSFVLPNQDPSGASYNITQALISIGSGGWWGKGLFQGTQSHLRFLRVRHTDFVFSVFAEEFGFIGSMLLLGLFLCLILRTINVALTANDRYGRLVAGGVACMLFGQTFINLGMNANLLPVTGLPLPLISYGGSSLVSTMMVLGVVESIAIRRGQGPTWSLRSEQ